jgi:hypothetical protein
MLLNSGDISQSQYNRYTKGKDRNELLKIGLILGGIILAGYLITELAKNK